MVEEKLSHGVNVVAINASWGGAGYNAVLRDAINAAGAAGIIFCAAAGNGDTDRIGDNNDATPQYPSSYDCPNIIAVAPTTSTDTLARSSNYGATSVDLAAPGVGILSTVPGGGYASMSGTSMATAHVTGAVALCAAQSPSETVAQRVQRILDHVDPLASLSGKTSTGGRLDVAEAVIPAPSITLFTPTSGPLGSTVTLIGIGFTGATAVTFNGVEVSFVLDSAEQIAATVPADATSGPIAVVTPRGIGTSASSFTVIPVPSIAKLTPAARKRGKTVTLSGSGFGVARGTGSVKFGSRACGTYLSWSDTQIKCTVPMKAKFGTVTVAVTTAGGRATP